jgi:hypothetical protein
LAIAHERGEQEWQSLMIEGSGDSEKLISDGSMGSNTATLQKEALTFNYFSFLNFFLCLQVTHPKTKEPFGEF